MKSKKILKCRLHRKFVRKQKQLIRHRNKKHRPRKWCYVQLTFTEVELLDKLRAEARKRGCSVGRVIRETLKKYMEMCDGTENQLRQSHSQSKGSQG